MKNISELTTELFDNIKVRGDEKAFDLFNILIRQHPTNQASIIDTLAGMLELYSEIHPDVRNQAAVDYAKNATNHYKSNPIPFI